MIKFHSNVISLHFGLPRPVRILQLTDVHLSLADETDGEELQAHAAKRRRTFFNEADAPARDPVGFLEEAMRYAEGFDCTVITGDVLDFTSHANRETAKRILAGRDYLFCAGNHEFCPRVGIPDTFEQKHRVYDEIQSLFRGDMGFESRIVGGVNVIAMDNSYCVWTGEQFERLQAEIGRGLPCILFCHTPLTCKEMWHKPSLPSLPVPEEVAELTRTVNNYIIGEPGIRAVFSGHLHNNGTERLGDKTGYILGGLFKGIVGEIVID